jgi:4-carboxymuconolactone decarboxylase
MQDPPKPHISPLLPPDWDDVALEALGAFPRGLAFVLKQWNAGGQDARGMHLLGVLARYPALAKAYLTFSGYIAAGTALPNRIRELAILRIAWLRRTEYEYVQHVVMAKLAGISDAEIERVRLGADAPGWHGEEGEVVRAADELFKSGRISRETWNRLATVFDKRQLVDLIFVVGCYDMLATLILTLDLPLEPGVSPLDDSLRARMFGGNETRD